MTFKFISFMLMESININVISIYHQFDYMGIYFNFRSNFGFIDNTNFDAVINESSNIKKIKLWNNTNYGNNYFPDKISNAHGRSINKDIKFKPGDIVKLVNIKIIHPNGDRNEKLVVPRGYGACHKIRSIYDYDQNTNNQSFVSYDYLLSLKKNNYQEVNIYGNAPSLNYQPPEYFVRGDKHILSIGLNRIFLKFHPDLIIFGHDEIIPQWRENSIPDDKVYILKTCWTNRYIEYFKKYGFNNLPQGDLFTWRNILNGALHLCFILEIKKINFYGFEFSNNEHFYNTRKYFPRELHYKLETEFDDGDRYMGWTIKETIEKALECLKSKGHVVRSYDRSPYLVELQEKGLLILSENNAIKEET